MMPIVYILIALVLVIAGVLVLQLKNGTRVKKEVTSFQNIFRHTNDALMLMDILDGKIVYANLGAVDLLGYPLETLYAKTIFDLHEREQLAKSSETIARVYEEKGLIYSDLPFVNSKGEKIAVECSAKVEDFAGKPVIFIAARDIRERLRMEEQIKAQNAIIEQKNKDLIDSITYAQNIQHAILPSLTAMHEAFNDMFVLYLPKDIVSGDFYWMAHPQPFPVGRENKAVSNAGDIAKAVLVAACDCTGHGVPGAMVSVVCSNAMNRAVKEFGLTEPGMILDKTRELVLETFEKSEGDIKDGMDISLASVTRSKEGTVVSWAGAYNPLWYIESGEMKEITADKQPVGKMDNPKPFTTHTFTVSTNGRNKGGLLYLFTDGFADQFGGDKGKKYRSAHMKEFLLGMQGETMEKQKDMLYKEFTTWKGNNEQVDDVLVIGIRI